MKDASGNIVLARILARAGIPSSGVTITGDPMLAQGFLMLVLYTQPIKG